MKRLFLIISLGFCLSTYAQNVQLFGVGFVLGAPTGLSLSIQNAQFLVAYSLINEPAILSIVDLKLVNEPLLLEVKNFYWYLGPGFALEVIFPPSDGKLMGRSSVSNLWLGTRVVIGASWRFLQFWELFLELGPGVYLFPAVQFLGTGGLGIRYYF